MRQRRRTRHRTQASEASPSRTPQQQRLFLASGVFGLLGAFIVAHLFDVMIVNHRAYAEAASNVHEVTSNLAPERGKIYAQDSRSGEEYPVAMNRDVFTVFVDTRTFHEDVVTDELVLEDEAERLAVTLSGILEYDDEEKFALYLKFLKPDDPYEPIEKRVEEDIVDRIRELGVRGIGFVREPVRVYPEGTLASHVLGFVGKDDNGGSIGRYGLEGYWQEELGGKEGYFSGIRSAAGKLIPLAGKKIQPAEDGADILITIDRTLQYRACKELARAAEEYQAESASLIIMEPHTGAIRALCNVPDYDPNVYNQVESVEVYNNRAVFTPYEPGSVFKPIAMAAALNEKAVEPHTPFFDTGSVEANCQKEIKNAGGKIYGDTDMIGVLENSINTGMVFVVEQVGKKVFRNYVEQFGFGIKAGIGLDTETTGVIESLWRSNKDEMDCFAATGSFGQGITATPLQMTSAFSAIANGGVLMKPYLVEEIRYPDGKTKSFDPIEVDDVVSSRAASLLGGMLVNVIDSGQAGGAKVPGYFLAGKTGTAQIAEKGVYIEDAYNHSFVGFGPIDAPVFTMIVTFEKPEQRYSASTAAPTFGTIAKIILEHYGVPPSREADE